MPENCLTYNKIKKKKKNIWKWLDRHKDLKKDERIYYLIEFLI